jgi:hypothetical protein
MAANFGMRNTNGGPYSELLWQKNLPAPQLKLVTLIGFKSKVITK